MMALAHIQAIAQLKAFAAALEAGDVDCVALSVVEAPSGETTLSIQVATLTPTVATAPTEAPPPTPAVLEDEARCTCGRRPEHHGDGWDCVCGMSFKSAGPS